MIDSERFIQDCTAIRSQNPLIHNITNYVAMNFAANALLAVGASPLMSFYSEEMEEMVAASAAVSINLGCLDEQIIKAGEMAAGAAVRYGKPWVLDPVGAGVSRVRTLTACHLALDFHPSIIRGNAAEIAAMAAQFCDNDRAGEIMTRGRSEHQRGVDCVVNDIEWAKSVAMRLAEATGSVVVASGETDCVTDGKRVELITRGCPSMAKITAMGCSETTVCAAFTAVESDPFYAAVGAMLLYGIAGEVAAKCRGWHSCEGHVPPGSFQTAFLDALSDFTLIRKNL